MRKKGIVNRIYKKGQDFLRLPLFRGLVNVFSHGITHFIGLAFFAAMAIFIYNENKRDKITPHRLGINIGRITDYNPEYKDAKKISLGDVSIDIHLNSAYIAGRTGGRFHNGIDAVFNGDSIYAIRTFLDTKIYEDTTITSSREFIDSILVSFYNNIPYRDYDFDGTSSIIINNTKGYPEKDSLGNFILYRSKDDNVDLNVHKKVENDPNVATVLIEPKPQNVDHTINFYCDDIGVNANDPYYYYHIAFPSFNFNGKLKIRFSIGDIHQIDTYNIMYCEGKNLQYNYLYPEPDIVGNGWIEYNSLEKKELIRRNQGVIIQAVDIDLLNKQNQRGFLFSVLIGTCVAFALDIIIQLIREMRRLQSRKEEEEE